MPQYRVSEAATADLDAIWLYVAEQGGLDAAGRQKEMLHGAIQVASQRP
jgi:plasmid stabilization system protein ParE